MKPINVAICGAGIGAEHLQAYLALPDLYRVCYIADPDADRAAALVNPVSYTHLTLPTILLV